MGLSSQGQAAPTSKEAEDPKKAFEESAPEGYELPWWQGFVGKNPRVKDQVEESRPAKDAKEKGKREQGGFKLPWWNVSVSMGGPADEGSDREKRSEGSPGAKSVAVEFLAPAYERAVVGNLVRMSSIQVHLGLPRSHLISGMRRLKTHKMLGRRLQESVLWTARKKREGEGALEDSTPYLMDRFEYEFLLNLVRTAKHFYSGVDDERDRSYGTIGQFTAAYRHVLFPNPKNIWEDRLSASVFVYKLGTNSPEFKHMRTGGWAFLEYNMHTYRDPTHRFLLMLAPVGMVKDNVAYKKARSSAVRWAIESAAGVEGLWKLGMVSPSVRAFFIPRYDKVWAYRLHSEVAIRIRISELDVFTSRWFTEVVLVPKLLYLYNSDPIVTQVTTGQVLRKWPLPGWLDWLDFRKDLTAYVQVEFRLKE